MKISKYQKRIFKPFTALSGEAFCQVKYGGRTRIFSLSSHEFEMEYKRIYRKQKREMISRNQYEKVLAVMRLDAYENRVDYDLETRIFREEDGSIIYNLNPDKSQAVYIKNGKATLEEMPEMRFKYDPSIRNQVEPNLKIKPHLLPKFLERHFHFKKDDLLVLSLFLVSAFSGTSTPHNILILAGSKGSGKSRAARLLLRIVDPQDLDLVSLPKTKDDLAIRLHNSYITVLDNISYLNSGFSDIIAQCATGGICYVKRTLYQNSEETKLDLRSILILTGIEVVAKKSDVKDRSILLFLERLKPDEIMGEKELEEAFQEDLPKILGACLKLLAIAVNDDTPVDVPKTRMASAFELMVKVGRAMGFDDEYTADILWKNQKKVSLHTIFDSPFGECIIAFFEEYESFTGLVREFKEEIQKIAKDRHMAKNVVPEETNVFSRRLGEIQSELELLYGIKYKKRSNGRYHEIDIWVE